jgi:RNA polymerase sigma-70 factor, ECF subfamily
VHAASVPEQQELVARVADDGAPEVERLAAERELCRYLAPRIRLYGLRHLRNEAAADDLVQEVLLVVLRAARENRIESPELVDRFALGTSRNLVARAHRSEKRSKALEDTVLASIEDALPPPFSELDAARLAVCLGKLRAREQRVVMMTFQEDRSANEIALEIGTSAGNVRVLRHRAIAQLQLCVEGGAA